VAKLRKYVEWMTQGRRTDRIAYVMKQWDLPIPLPGAEWHLDAKFNAAEEILRDPNLKTVFEAALEKGAEVIIRRDQRAWHSALSLQVRLGLLTKMSNFGRWHLTRPPPRLPGGSGEAFPQSATGRASLRLLWGLRGNEGEGEI
jgi:hypothetical protein